jgi:hypothetical protein
VCLPGLRESVTPVALESKIANIIHSPESPPPGTAGARAGSARHEHVHALPDPAHDQIARPASARPHGRGAAAAGTAGGQAVAVAHGVEDVGVPLRARQVCRARARTAVSEPAPRPTGHMLGPLDGGVTAELQGSWETVNRAVWGPRGADPRRVRGLGHVRSGPSGPGPD